MSVVYHLYVQDKNIRMFKVILIFFVLCLTYGWLSSWKRKMIPSS